MFVTAPSSCVSTRARNRSCILSSTSVTSLIVKELPGDCQVAQKFETTVPLVIGLGFSFICMKNVDHDALWLAEEIPQLQFVENIVVIPDFLTVQGAPVRLWQKRKLWRSGDQTDFSRIITPQFRHGTCLGGSSSCCGACTTRSRVESSGPSAKSTLRRECAHGFRVHSSIAKSEASILVCQAIESAMELMVEPLGRWSCVSVQPVS